MISELTSLEELATVVSEALEHAGITATLSGGAAVSIYTDNDYESEDLDFVTAALVNELKAVLEPLGFVHTGQPRLSVFDHPKTKWYLEFPPAPLSFGGTYIDPSNCAHIDTGIGHIRIITPTHSVMDRLIAAAAWNEPQSLEQALLVTAHCEDEIDWRTLDEWVAREGIQSSKEIVEYYEKTKRKRPM
jgi:hypothetical protein